MMPQTDARNTTVKLPEGVEALLRCPKCGGHLERRGETYRCLVPTCAAWYPVVNGVPVLIDEESSVFTLEEFVQQRDTYFVSGTPLERLLARVVPDISINPRSRRNYRRVARELLQRAATPRVLVLGGGILGENMGELLTVPALQLVETDVTLAPRTVLVCDAHAIPFADGAFDAVIVQAVLEHVADPYRCVEEIFRVLAPNGLVYAETPFMQQVHGGKYDFTRFTLLGHRRLFRRFAEIESGAAGGPGMVLAWSLMYFFRSFTASKHMRQAVTVLARCLFFPLKYLDYALINRVASLDAASGYYFIGCRTDHMLSDREILDLYRGAW